MAKSADLMQELTQARDELRVQLHLGSMEAKEQWEQLEKKWSDFSAKAQLEETSEDVEESLQKLGSELSKGYAQIKAALTKRTGG